MVGRIVLLGVSGQDRKIKSIINLAKNKMDIFLKVVLIIVLVELIVFLNLVFIKMFTDKNLF